MKHQNRTSPAFLATLICCAAAVASCAGSQRLDPTPASLQGAWSGEALVRLVAGRDLQPLPLAIDITADGRVSGAVGGAQIRDGYLAANRGSVGRAVDIKTDYILRGALVGSVITGEPAPSAFFMAPFNLIESAQGAAQMRGGLTTWDNPHGGKNPIVGARDLVLRRR